MGVAVAILMIGMGLAIAGVWTRDIIVGDKVDLSPGILRAREQDSGSLLWPHWVAEYSTAATLIAGGIGLLADSSWARVVAPAALGALLYTSTNSLGWALADRERFVYSAPMIAGVVVGLGGIVYLLLR